MPAGEQADALAAAAITGFFALPLVGTPERVAQASAQTAPVDLAGAAAAALAPLLGDVRVEVLARLPGSARSVVARARARDGAGREHRVVLKAPAAAGPGPAREEAALRLAARRRLPGVVPLLAVSEDPPLLVLADVGDGPTLADRLLASDPAAAERALGDWAQAVGALQAASRTLRQEFADGLAAASPLGAPPVDRMPEAVVEAAAALTALLPRLGVAPDPAALEELRAVPEELGPGSALVPGDTCPSNAVETADGLVLLDLEGAEHRHPAWEGAYLTVPWPTCWCSWRLPDQGAAAARGRWAAALGTTGPVPGEDDLVRATVAWVLVSAGHLLPAALAGDPPAGPPLRPEHVPARRALLQHRLRLAAEQAVLPAVADLAAQAHAAAVREWGPQPLATAPAFR